MSRRTRRSGLEGAEPLSPQKRWRAIIFATLVLAPAMWSIIAGIVAASSDEPDAPAGAPLIAFGLAVVPFAFLVLAFVSEHPRAPGAVLRAMALSLLVGVVVGAAWPDPVTPLVAGLAAGGLAALRHDPLQSWKPRVIAAFAATVFVFLLLLVSDVGLVVAPALPFTSIGVADELAERRTERRATEDR